MFEVTIASVIALLIAWYGCVVKSRQPLLVPGLIIAIFFALRYNYTNDYPAYAKIFYYINVYENWDYAIWTRNIEMGWKILNRLCKPLGFQFVVALTTFFQIGTFCWFAGKYVPKKWQWIIFFFYVFDPWYMLMGLSAMRQTVSLCLLMIAMPSIINRRLIKAALIWGIALMFHNSAVTAIPILFAGFLKPKYWKAVVVVISILMVIVIASPAVIFGLIKIGLSSMAMTKYIYYFQHVGGNALGTGLGLMFRLVMLGYLLYLLKFQNRTMFIFGTIYSVMMMFPFLGLGGSYLGRIGWYFSWLGMPALIIYVSRWRHSLLDRTIFVLYVLVIVMAYYNFFTDYFPEGYLRYKSILDTYL